MQTTFYDISKPPSSLKSISKYLIDKATEKWNITEISLLKANISNQAQRKQPQCKYSTFLCFESSVIQLSLVFKIFPFCLSLRGTWKQQFGMI